MCSSRPARPATLFYAAVRIVLAELDELAARTGRRYGLVDYAGAPDAERVLVLMGSGVGAAAEAVDALVEAGERVGLVTVRLYRPFPAEALAAALPATVRRGGGAGLDQGAGRGRRAVPGRGVPWPSRPPPAARPRRWWWAAATTSPPRSSPRRWPGRPGQPGRRRPRNHYGQDRRRRLPGPACRWTPASRPRTPPGCGRCSSASGPTAPSGPARPGEDRRRGHDLFAEGYFVYDSKKSGSVTVSHLRMGPRPIRSSYLIEQATFVACHQFHFLDRMEMLGRATPGAHPSCSTAPGRRTGSGSITLLVQREIIDKHLDLWVDAAGGREAGMGHPDQHRHAAVLLRPFGVLPRDPGGRGHQGLGGEGVQPPGQEGGGPASPSSTASSTRCTGWRSLPRRPAPATGARPCRAGARLRQAGHGSDDGGQRRPAPVSALPVDGAFPTGTAKWEKRSLPAADPHLGPVDLHRLRQVRL